MGGTFWKLESETYTEKIGKSGWGRGAKQPLSITVFISPVPESACQYVHLPLVSLDSCRALRKGRPEVPGNSHRAGVTLSQ